MSTPAAVHSQRGLRLDWQGMAFVLLGLAMGGAMVFAGKAIYVVQGGVASLATLLPLGYAFSAGMVATVNPCGVLLLPSLVAYYLGRGEATDLSGWQRAEKSLLLGLMATLGFVTVFTVVGLVIGAGGRVLVSTFPVGGLVVGVALALLGAWLALTGREMGLLAASRAMDRVQLGSGLRSPFLFGIAYAVASLACTLPVFLVVAGSALAAGGPLRAVVQFFSYALGMGTVLTAVILGATFFQGAVTRSLRRAVPYVHRLAASFLVGAGIFVANYWLSSGLL